ncbi:hypothetical protein B0H13DRAFT_1925058, partial [Mycena leptocephala]
ESFFFPELEKKLGTGALSQHKEFVPQLIELKDFLEAVKSEARVLESSRMLAAFTEKDLKDIDAAFMKLALQKIEFVTTLPLSVVCGNPATPWFPLFPLPLKWATRRWFARKYNAAWEFGPLDLHGNPRALDKAGRE